ncbi:MAG: ATP-grasp domain-containing protein [Candidatus Marinimicrobia bacterium]|nr:ATP-grasp domain-containing protein [Candidatus Neomarinimicrobiota bacterium]
MNKSDTELIGNEYIAENFNSDQFQEISNHLLKENVSILIPDGDSDFALPVIECLSRIPKIKIVVLSHNRWSIARFTKHNIVYRYSELAETEAGWIDALISLMSELEIDMVLPVDQYTIGNLTCHKTLFHQTDRRISVPPVSSFEIATDKWLQAELMMNNHLSTPYTILIDSLKKIEAGLSEISYPVLTKPRKSSNGEGIILWNDKANLLRYLREEAQLSEIVIQSYVKGGGVDCSVLCRDGVILAYTIQESVLPGNRPFGPAGSIRFAQNEEVLSLAEGLIKSLSWSGMAHIDMIYDEDEKKYKIIEINPRYWASLLGSLSVGVNFPYLACLDHLGVQFLKPPYRSEPYLSGRALFRIFLKNPFSSSARSVGFKKTSLKYILSDPLPTLVKMLRKIYRLSSKKLSSSQSVPITDH